MSNFCDDPPLFQEPALVPAIALPLEAIPENSLTDGTVLGTIPVSDGEDAPAELIVSLLEGNIDTNGNGTPAFAIEADNGTFSLVVADADDLDFELTQAFNLTVQVVDTDLLSSTTAIAIGLVNDPADTDSVGDDSGEPIDDDGIDIDIDTGAIAGTDGDDAIIGGEDIDAMNDLVLVGAGNDTVDLSPAPDAADNIVLAGSGNDDIAASQNDIISGGSGDDTLNATDSSGGNRISGGEGNDTLILGVAGGDRFLGGAGDDTFLFAEGGAGGNILSGGSGVDTFVLPPGESATEANAIADFDVTEDVFAGIDFADVDFDGSNVLVDGGVIATLLGVDAAILTAANFI